MNINLKLPKGLTLSIVPRGRTIAASMEVYAVYENGSLLALSTDLAAASTLQGELPNADLLVVEIDDTVWNDLQKQTEITIKRLGDEHG